MSNTFWRHISLKKNSICNCFTKLLGFWNVFHFEMKKKKATEPVISYVVLVVCGPVRKVFYKESQFKLFMRKSRDHHLILLLVLVWHRDRWNAFPTVSRSKSNLSQLLRRAQPVLGPPSHELLHRATSAAPRPHSNQHGSVSLHPSSYRSATEGTVS